VIRTRWHYSAFVEDLCKDLTEPSRKPLHPWFVGCLRFGSKYGARTLATGVAAAVGFKLGDLPGFGAGTLLGALGSRYASEVVSGSIRWILQIGPIRKDAPHTILEYAKRRAK
jgi:hypothetical protein